MINPVLAGVVAVVMMSGVASAQTYIPMSPPPASVGIPGSTMTTTTVSPTTDHVTTITKGVDTNGNEITKKDTYREGISGTTESHTTRSTDPDGGATTTRSKTTTKQE